MTTSATLPGSRPSPGAYGPDLENDKPIQRPTRELDAGNWNKIAADVAQIASTVPLAVVAVSGAGGLLSALGVLAGNVSVSRSSAGTYTVNFAAAGLAVTCVTVSASEAVAALAVATAASATVVAISMMDPGLTPTDGGFVLVVY